MRSGGGKMRVVDGERNKRSPSGMKALGKKHELSLKSYQRRNQSDHRAGKGMEKHTSWRAWPHSGTI
jgi:hypothetical protein